MVIGHHIIITAYGFWLPNDPRGSWSDFIGSWELYTYGEAMTVNTTRSLADVEHDRKQREAAKRALKYPPVIFNGVQARAIARGFAEYVNRANLLVHACSIMPDHVHLAIARHRLKAESIANQLKGAATRHIIDEGLHPLVTHQKPGSRRPPRMWARGQWVVFLDAERDMRRAIGYVENNPLREGYKPQRWRFVQPYDG